MIGSFPQRRMRRNRSQIFSRQLVKEHDLKSQDLIYPVFIVDEKKSYQKIPSMPDQYRLGEEELFKTAEICLELGIPALAIFPCIEKHYKSSQATEAYNPNGLVAKRIYNLKKRYPKLGIIADIALDPYTDHGHDGIIDKHTRILNDKTISVLAKQACVCSEAGADIVAPSDMMDGRIQAIRKALDDKNFTYVQILSYSAKYASNFYGPFRSALGSANYLKNIDKKSYQMDPSNSDEAIHQVRLDIQEGADMILIKPASYYSDIIYRVKKEFLIPTFSYQVSGEYAMLKAAAKEKWIDEKLCVLESLLSLKRAGSNGIFSYYALQAARWLKELPYE